VAEEERRMLFDIRGRRKRVIQFVYATLALLMGASLFLVVGPFNLGELAGGGNANEAAEVLDEQAARVEAKLRAEPNSETLLLSLARSRVAAGNAELETDPQTGRSIVTLEARQDFDRAAEAWQRYLERADEPNPSAAFLVAGTYFNLAESSGTLDEIEENLEAAAETQRLAAAARPSTGALTTLVSYEYFAGNFAAAEEARRQARAKTPSSLRGQLKAQLAEFRKQGENWAAEKKRIRKLEAEQGKESLQSPFGGLGAGSGSLGE